MFPLTYKGKLEAEVREGARLDLLPAVLADALSFAGFEAKAVADRRVTFKPRMGFGFRSPLNFLNWISGGSIVFYRRESTVVAAIELSFAAIVIPAIVVFSILGMASTGSGGMSVGRTILYFGAMGLCTIAGLALLGAWSFRTMVRGVLREQPFIDV